MALHQGCLKVRKGAAQKKKVRIDCNFKKQAELFSGEDTKDEIILAGEEVSTCLYGANLRERGWLHSVTGDSEKK